MKVETDGVGSRLYEFFMNKPQKLSKLSLKMRVMVNIQST